MNHVDTMKIHNISWQILKASAMLRKVKKGDYPSFWIHLIPPDPQNLSFQTLCAWRTDVKETESRQPCCGQLGARLYVGAQAALAAFAARRADRLSPTSILLSFVWTFFTRSCLCCFLPTDSEWHGFLPTGLEWGAFGTASSRFLFSQQPRTALQNVRVNFAVRGRSGPPCQPTDPSGRWTLMWYTWVGHDRTKLQAGCRDNQKEIETTYIYIYIYKKSVPKQYSQEISVLW